MPTLRQRLLAGALFASLVTLLGASPAPSAAPTELPRLTGDADRLATAYARAARVHAEIAGGAWEAAGAGLGELREGIYQLSNRPGLRPGARQGLLTLLGELDALDLLVKQRDPAALKRAGAVLDQFGQAVLLLRSPPPSPAP